MKSSQTRTELCAGLALLVALATAAAAQGPPPPAPRGGLSRVEPAEWREFTSRAGGFKVSLPGEPRIRKEPMVRGPLTFERHIHELYIGDSYMFEVDYVDMPAGYNDPELTLEGGISGMTRRMVADGGRVLTNEKVVRGRCEGREATVSFPHPATRRPGFAHGRVFSSGQRYYILLFIGPGGDNPASAQMGRRFMESFVVSDGCSAAVSPVTAPSAPPTVRAVAGTPDPATGWRRIDAADHGFSVLMPGPAELETEQAQVEPIPLWHHTYSHEAGDAFYSAELFGDYPPGFFSGPDSLEPLLDVTLAALKRNLSPFGFTFEHTRDLKLGPYPGREFAIASETLGARGRAQLYMTPRRSYVFISFDSSARPDPRALERFFSSIKIAPN